MSRIHLLFLSVFIITAISPTIACNSQSTPVITVETDSVFVSLVAQLSEPGGYFDTDNLISNEASYLHVIETLDSLSHDGGAYIGVGPDQNFSYIARIKPEIAFLIDIRRDNLLQHLLFKALFTMADTRIAYLCLLFDKAPPDSPETWHSKSVQDLVNYIDTAPRATRSNRTDVLSVVDQFGLTLSEEDLATISRIHDAFIEAGMNLQFNSHLRRPLPEYPTYRDLTLARTSSGAQANYLTDEAAYVFLRDMQTGHRIIPIVGDLAGPHALAAIGAYLKPLNFSVAAFYTSNVEYYLMQQNQFDDYLRNVMQLPVDEKSVIIRSYFNRWAPHPLSVPGYASTQLLQSIEVMIGGYEQGAYRSYRDLINKDYLGVVRDGG